MQSSARQPAAPAQLAQAAHQGPALPLLASPTALDLISPTRGLSYGTPPLLSPPDANRQAALLLCTAQQAAAHLCKMGALGWALDANLHLRRQSSSPAGLLIATA